MSDKGYSRITIKVRDDWNFRDKIKEAALSSGESVNGFMIRAIHEEVVRSGVKISEEILKQIKANASEE